MGSVRVFFRFSNGISQDMIVPRGTVDSIKEWFELITDKLKLSVIVGSDGVPRWETSIPPDSVPEENLHLVYKHNDYLIELFGELSEWHNNPPTSDFETLTQEMANSLWYGFSHLYLPPHRWTAEIYAEQMQIMFDVMSGCETDGLSFDNPLTKDQAAEVIWLLGHYLDYHNLDLELPVGRDFLATSDEYVWCQKCGAILYEDVLWSDDVLNDDEDDNLEEDKRPICPYCGGFLD